MRHTHTIAETVEKAMVETLLAKLPASPAARIIRKLPLRVASIGGKRQLIIDSPALVYPLDGLFAEDIASMTGTPFHQMWAILAARKVPYTTVGQGARRIYAVEDVRHLLADIMP